MERKDTILSLQETNQKKRKWLHVVIDVSSVVIVFLVWMSLREFAEPVKSGFFCDEDSLKKPYIKKSYVSKTVLLMEDFLLPLISMICIEVIYADGITWRRKLTAAAKSVYCMYGPFLFGLLSTFALTEAAKLSTGFLRPNFLKICKPNVNCTENRYIRGNAYKCDGHKLDLIKQNKMSFWSTHAATASFSMVYLVMYLQYRVTRRELLLPRVVFQMLFLSLAYISGISRISDNKHHLPDVLVGFLVGSMLAILMVHNVKNRWQGHQKFRNISRQMSVGQSSIKTTTSMA